MDLWFGDSWTIGHELGKEKDQIGNTTSYDKNIFPNVVGRDNPLYAFSTLVSNYRKQPYINFAKAASSIDFSLHELITFCSTKYNSSESYTAFLCTTAQNRGFGISEALNRKIEYCNTTTKTEYDIFIYDSIIAMNCFYSVCKMYNIKCFIIPIFCDLILPESMANLVLFNDSLLTPTSLVEETFGTKFIESSTKFHTDEEMHSLPCKHLNWIHPNKLHPNIFGHRKMSYKFVELLENR